MWVCGDWCWIYGIAFKSATTDPNGKISLLITCSHFFYQSPPSRYFGEVLLNQHFPNIKGALLPSFHYVLRVLMIMICNNAV
jgi:hypothetical protein